MPEAKVYESLRALVSSSREFPEDASLARYLAKLVPQTGLGWDELPRLVGLDPTCVQNARIEFEKMEQHPLFSLLKT